LSRDDRGERGARCRQQSGPGWKRQAEFPSTSRERRHKGDHLDDRFGNPEDNKRSQQQVTVDQVAAERRLGERSRAGRLCAQRLSLEGEVVGLRSAEEFLVQRLHRARRALWLRDVTLSL
jgi:hypothetical protein